MKEFLLFIFLLVFDLVIWIILQTFSTGALVIIYSPLIFIEIAFFGCIILYKLNHKGGDDDE